MWSEKRPVRSIQAGAQLRIVGRAPFRLEWTRDDWTHRETVEAVATRIGVWYADISTERLDRVRFRLSDSGGTASRENEVSVDADRLHE